MSIPEFINNEIRAARTRYERVRTGAVARVALYPTDTDYAVSHTVAYFALARERCIELVGGLDTLMSLCRKAQDPVALKACEDLSGALWRLANGLDLAGIELRWPEVIAQRPAA
jgi:hypothetical protein